MFTLILLIDFTENSGRLSALPGYNFWGALFFSLLRLPAILEQLLPFITLFSGIIMLISMNRNLELVIVYASGVSVWNLLLPFCFGSFLLGICAFFFLNPLSTWGALLSKTLVSRWQENISVPISEKATSLWLTQYTNDGKTTFGTKTVFNKGKILVDATFVRFEKDNTIHDWIHTKTAKLENGYWLLLDGIRYQVNRTPEKFDRICIPTLIEAGFFEEQLQLASQKTAVPFYNLPRAIRIAQSFGHSTNVFIMQLQTLLALPVFLVAMTLIAVSISLKFSRDKRSSLAIWGGALSGFLLYIINVLVRTLGYNGYIPPILAAWFPVLIALLLGISFLIYKEKV